MIAPRRRRSVPEIARSSVLLPAPLLPSTATTPPSGTASDTPRQRAHGARVADVEIPDVQQDAVCSSQGNPSSVANVSGCLMHDNPVPVSGGRTPRRAGARSP